MERDWPANEEGRDAHLLAVLQLVSTKSGVEFDATADVWTYRDGVNNVYLDFNQLPNSSREFRESAKSVLSWYAENRSPNHLRNMFNRLQHFLRASTREVSSVSDVDLLNYKAGLTKSTNWYLGSLAGLLRKWRRLGYPGVRDDAELLLKQLRVKGNDTGVAVLTWDVHEGPFTHIEMEAIHTALNRAYADGALSTANYVLAWLYILLGQRNKQHAALKVCDVLVKRDAKGMPTYSILMPSAKKRADHSRANLVERPLVEQFGELLAAYAQSVQTRFEAILPDPRQAPLFPTSRPTRSSPGFEFHRSSSIIGQIATRTFESLGVVSERIGKAMSISAVRFRRTIGTRAAEEGLGPLVIAYLLNHTDIQHIGVYSASSPAIIERIDRAIAMYMAPLAQAFEGTLLEGLGEDTSRRIIDLRVDRSGTPMGDCGKHGYCGFNAPFACYTCTSFEAWVDGPHEAVLQHLLNQRFKQLKTLDKRIASIHDRTIFAVAAVIQACTEAKLLPAEDDEKRTDDEYCPLQATP